MDNINSMPFKAGSVLLTIALLTYICGDEDYVDMSEFAHVRARDFGLLAECVDRSPSPDTFERLMSAVAPPEIERCLIEHGHIETRDCRILDAGAIEYKNVANRWPGLKTLVEITSTVDYGGETVKTTQLYISDENFPKAAYFNMLARGHWSIENQLHWNSDVTFKEYAYRARKDFTAQNLSSIRKLAMQQSRDTPTKEV